MGFLSPLYLLLTALAAGIDYGFSRPIALRHPRARAMLVWCVVKDLALFVVCSSLAVLGRLDLPLAVAIPAFTSLGYLTDLYHGEADLIRDPVSFGLFCFFFGKLYVGPIVTANDFIPQLRSARLSAEGVETGMTFLIRGLAKKVILADSLRTLLGRWESYHAAEPSVLGAWVRVILYVLYVYFLLSGFSDMATGTGAVFGLTLPENFHHPLQSSSVTDFFSRFNISANRFVRKYVYQALGAEDNGPLATSVNILLTTMLMGLWYGIRLNFLTWGAFLGLFIIIEVLYIEKNADRLPPFLCRAYTFVAVLFSFCWFCGRTLADSFRNLQLMFGIGAARGVAPGCLYLLESNWLLLLISVFFCLRVLGPVSRRLVRRHPFPARLLSLGSSLFLLATTLAYLV